MEVEGFRVAKKDSGSSGITNPNSRQMTEMQWLDGEHQSRRPFRGRSGHTALANRCHNKMSPCDAIYPKLQGMPEIWIFM